MRRIGGHYVAVSRLLFGLAEASLIAAGCCAVFYYFYYRPGSSSLLLLAFAGVLSGGIIALMHSGGLYNGEAVRDLKRTAWRISLITAPIFALAVWTTGELAKHSEVPIYPYRWQWTGALTGVWVLSAICLRLLFRQICQSGVLTRRVILVGSSVQMAELADLAGEAGDSFRVVGHLDAIGHEIAHPGTALPDLARQLRASEIVISIGDRPLPWSLLAQCRLAGIGVMDYLDFYEREARRIRIDVLRDDWIALSRGFTRSGIRERLRRATDIVLSLVGALATAPVLVLTALAIKLEDGGAVLYRQERIGLGGRSFMLLKFRSMGENAEIDGTPAWAAERDSRITSVGHIIRRVRIDELPQLWNVLRGEMTLVGPRPERPYFVEQFSDTIPFYDYRHTVRPGITGWAQVSFRYGASLEDTRRKLSYDLYYIKNRGLLLDIIILLRTMGVVLKGEGAR